jgi:4-diphosphocytidyl-2-C-methyl-D-erythritol kinase
VRRAARVHAPAKVNLRLRVLARRPDGYHDIETLFQAIDLADEVVVERKGRGVELEVRGANVGPVSENLAFRAASRLRAEAGLEHGLRVTLTKRVPAGAGLGGGSSDAAAVLRCVARLAGFPESHSLLFRVALELGSDVPFFLGSSPLALGRGRGEIIEPLPPLPAADLVLVSPPVHVSTAAAYGLLAEARRGRTREGGARALDRPPPVPATWREVAALADNDFESVVTRLHPEIARALAALRAAGASIAMMSGSGSSSFGLFERGEEAVRAAEALERELGWPCRPVRTLTALPEPVLV